MVVAEGNRATVDANLGVATARGQAQIEADEMVVAEANRATVDANLGVATAPAQAQFVDESGKLNNHSYSVNSIVDFKIKETFSIDIFRTIQLHMPYLIEN